MKNTPAHTVETARLRMRAPSMTDLAHFTRLWTDPAVMRFLPGGRPYTQEQSARALQSFIAHWTDRGFGVWSLLEKDTGRWIGYCGLRRLDEIAEVELLYGLEPESWNKGLITEAARAAVGYGFVTAGLERIVALALPENVASTRVMEHVGMRFERVAHLFGLDCVWYQVSREDYAVVAGDPGR